MALNPASDLTPLGSFEIEPIGTPIDVTPFFTPAILLEKNTWTTTAYDTCHTAKMNYSGADLTHVGLTGATITPSSNLSWSSGIGSVDITPVVSETDNSIKVTDPTTGISDTSNPFDTPTEDLHDGGHHGLHVEQRPRHQRKCTQARHGQPRCRLQSQHHVHVQWRDRRKPRQHRDHDRTA